MARSLISVFLVGLLLLSGCGGLDLGNGENNFITPEDQPEDTVPLEEAPTEDLEPEDAQPEDNDSGADPYAHVIPNFHVVADSYTEEYSTSDIEALETLLSHMRSVIASEAFEEEVLARTYRRNNGETTVDAQVVLDSIRNASKSIRFRKRTMGSHVLAMATVGGRTIWYPTGRSINISGNPCGNMNILFHELTHNLGYNHKTKVPYGLGPVVGRMYCELRQDDYFAGI